MTSFEAYKLLHVLGVVIFLGNIIVSGWWKVMAGRTRNPKIIAFAQRQVVSTDFAFTLTGVVLIGFGGWGASDTLGLGIETTWLAAGQVLFIGSGLIWIFALIPLQVRMSQLTKRYALAECMPEVYWRTERWWMILGSLAILLPVIALIFMVLKPI